MGLQNTQRVRITRYGMLHEDAMPRSFNPEGFAAQMKYRALLAPVFDYLVLLTESIDDTLMALGIDAIHDLHQIGTWCPPKKP